MILGTRRAVRVFAYPEAVDLRKGYDGLFGLVKQGLARDPLSGELYLLFNKRRDSCKVLVWDGTGLDCRRATSRIFGIGHSLWLHGCYPSPPWTAPELGLSASMSLKAGPISQKGDALTRRPESLTPDRWAPPPEGCR